MIYQGNVQNFMDTTPIYKNSKKIRAWYKEFKMEPEMVVLAGTVGFWFSVEGIKLYFYKLKFILLIYLSIYRFVIFEK